jgi:hypothetical protein
LGGANGVDCVLSGGLWISASPEAKKDMLRLRFDMVLRFSSAVLERPVKCAEGAAKISRTCHAARSCFCSFCRLRVLPGFATDAQNALNGARLAG